MTGLSGRGPVDRYLPINHHRPPVRSPPRMWAPSLNASATIIPAPGISGTAARHARRCSSDRKKLRVVQRVSQARRSSSARFPTQTMRPSASVPGPAGSTDNSMGPPQW